MTTLDTLQPGEPATIASLDGDGMATHRLMELGLLPGEPIEVLGRAPFGDPIAVLVRGTRIAIRAAEARRIAVAPPAPR
jgi:ferrous iron transport protein A